MHVFRDQIMGHIYMDKNINSYFFSQIRNQTRMVSDVSEIDTYGKWIFLVKN